GMNPLPKYTGAGPVAYGVSTPISPMEYAITIAKICTGIPGYDAPAARSAGKTTAVCAVRLAKAEWTTKKTTTKPMIAILVETPAIWLDTLLATHETTPTRFSPSASVMRVAK